MSHAVDYIVVDSRKEIMEVACDFASENVDRQENPHGTYHGNMHIVDGQVFSSEYDARKYIDTFSNGKWYYDMAVQFREPVDFKPSAKTVALKKKEYDLNEKLRTYKQEHSVHLRKSEYIGCPKCGSKLANKLFTGELCPVCRADLRPDTTKEMIRKYESSIKETHNTYEESWKADTIKQAKNGKVRWLVKVEVHC